MKTLSNKIALVTGGVRGIGRAIVDKLLEKEFYVITTYTRDEENATRLKSDYSEDNNRLIILKEDVSDNTSIDRICNASKEKWQDIPHFVVNNAGILKQGNFLNIKEAQWDKTFSVNLKGPFFICQKIISELSKKGDNGFASIVNIVSIGAQTGGPLAPDYAASKGALITFTQSMARIGAEYGIVVNAVSPGWIDTGIFSEERYESIQEEARQKVPLKRLGKPKEVADVVEFLLSDSASYITGQVINVNGGLYF